MNVSDIGFKGEKLIWEELKKLPDVKFGQIDILAKIRGKWILIEVKHQEKYNAPPFDGHGLPPWQVKFRMQFYTETGVIPYLWVIEKGTNISYRQSLTKLEHGKKYITATGSRVIYPLESFEKIILNSDQLQLF